MLPKDNVNMKETNEELYAVVLWLVPIRNWHMARHFMHATLYIFLISATGYNILAYKLQI